MDCSLINSGSTVRHLLTRAIGDQLTSSGPGVLSLFRYERSTVMKLKILGGFILGCLLYACPTALGQQVVISSQVVGSTPGQTVAGVASGGAPWVVTSATISISADGNVRSRIKGLIIPGTGVGPVTGVAASLVCGGSGGTVAATTASFPLTSGGNAKISDTIILPSSCVAPVVLIRVTSISSGPLPAPGPFIALSGFKTTATAESASTEAVPGTLDR